MKVYYVILGVIAGISLIAGIIISFVQKNLENEIEEEIKERKAIKVDEDKKEKFEETMKIILNENFDTDEDVEQLQEKTFVTEELDLNIEDIEDETSKEVNEEEILDI